MTYSEKIEYIKRHGKVPDKKIKSVLKIIGLILFSIFALVIFSLFVFKLVRTNWLDIEKGVWFILPFIAIIGCYGIFIPFSLKQEWASDRLFEVIPTNYSAKENLEIFTKILEDNFKVKRINVNEAESYIIMHTKISIFTWENRVTVITDDNKILVNSKSPGQPYCYGQNSRITRKIAKKARELRQTPT
jgi:hypothetical protein